MLSAIHLLDPDSAKLKQRPSLNRQPVSAASPPVPSSVVLPNSAQEPTKPSSTAQLPPMDRPSRPSPMLPRPRPLSPKPANAQKRPNNPQQMPTSADTTKSLEPLKSEKKFCTHQLEQTLLPPMDRDTSKLLAMSTTSTEPPVPEMDNAHKYASKATPPPSLDSETQRPLL